MPKPHYMISGYHIDSIISSLGHALLQFQWRPATYRPHTIKAALQYYLRDYPYQELVQFFSRKAFQKIFWV